ncbi:MAG: carboxylesterase family protein [Trebonia sp.]|jgi:para-nitrobenzyl esterase
MTVAETRYGKVRGAEIANGVLAWRGIPYAKPPVGDLRFRPPEPPEPWSGTRDALAYGDRSPQPELIPPPPGTPPMAEDCLYLNVTAPAGASGRPVLFWLHGGGYEGGQGPDQAGDGVAFANSHGLVIVTVNYRLGALGFLDVPGEGPTGAFGLHDQITALRWTYENIAAFGGDPEQITVYGLSAGAKSVTNLLASPLTRGLIARAAQSSGGDHVKDAAQARAITTRFLAELGATREGLRSVPAADILHAQTAIAATPRSVWVWRPSVDGAALTAKPLTAIAAGAAAGIPLLLQTCVRECAMYALLAPDAARQADRVLAEYFGQGTAAKILAGYAAQYPDLDEAALRTAIMTDERYVAPTERLADAQAAHGSVWRSRYDGPHTLLAADPQLAQYAPLLRGAHGADGAAIWQGSPGGEDDGGLPAALHSAWGKFATAGDPGWARYPVPGKPAMIFTDDGPRVSDGPFAHARHIWSALDWQPGTWWPFDGID